jgi:uncharacterized protein (DUF1800 family)
VGYSLSIEDSRHLWSRTGFGEINSSHQAFRWDGRREAVDRVLGLEKSRLVSLRFDTENYLLHKSKAKTKEQKRQFRKTVLNKDKKRLSYWWHNQIITTSNPLEEKMTVFWHRHFTSNLISAQPPIIYNQNLLFRENALGNFGVLLKQTLINPAIHLYLDNQKNTVKKPNENLARELLELYTMGEGSGYTEKDISEIARAITGYRPKGSMSEMTLIKRRHDAGAKTIFGNYGYYDLDSVIRLILEHPSTAKFISTKIVKEFLTENPSKQQIDHYASVFKNADYEIKPLLREIFLTKEFWQEKNNLVKSPYDLFKSAFSIYRENDRANKKLLQSLSNSGQRLFFPPDVKGWRTGQGWLSSDLILQRMRMLNLISKPLKNTKHTFLEKYYSLGDSGFNPRNKKFAIRAILKHDNFNFK